MLARNERFKTGGRLRGSLARKSVDHDGLAGRVAVVTGASRGIGRAVAQRFAQAGADLVLASRKAGDVERMADRLSQRHKIDAIGVACDVADAVSVRDLFRSVRAWRHGPAAVLANVAGYPIEPRLWNTPLHRLTEAELVEGFARVHAVDLVGSRLCTHYALKQMVPARRGSIVYVSSTPALAGYQGAPYTEAKAGLLGLMRDVARGYGRYGIRANAIAPGNIRTSWLDEISKAERRKLERENPLQRFGEPREVADLIAYLAGDRSSFVTGQTVVIDGGTVSH